jgi:hypothetical protein
MMMIIAIVTFFYGCIIMKKGTISTIAFFDGFAAKKAMATSYHLFFLAFFGGFVVKKTMVINRRLFSFYLYLLLWSFCYKEK